jgi:hypothetical protein
MTPEEAKLLYQFAVEELWRKGNVRDWYLKPKQKSALELLRIHQDPFFEASRRLGKTTTGLSFVIEESLLKKNHITRWCEPWKNQCREIVMTEMDKIQSRIPKKYQFRWRMVDSYYLCDYTGSRIYLRGVNEDRGESARGTAAHLIVVDELGSWREPTYVINEVLLPQILTTKGKIIKLGTPPKNLAHIYYKMKERSQLENQFIQRTIRDQEIVDEPQVERLVVAMGGWDSAAVRRELLCEKIVDPTTSIVPEWDDKMIEEVPRTDTFPYLLKYESIDSGVRDNFVVLFAYYDFLRAKLVVIDEIILSGNEVTTERVADLMREKEQEHWNVHWEEFVQFNKPRWRMLSPPNLRLKRVSDIDLRLINDMNLLHGIYVEKTDKGYLEEMVNQMRIFVGQGKLAVHPKCRNLIDCLRYGIWTDNKKDWQRMDKTEWQDSVEQSEFLGHFDALAALMYLIRNLDMHTNPIPNDFNKPEDNHFFDDIDREARKNKLRKMFNVGRHGKIDF